MGVPASITKVLEDHHSVYETESLDAELSILHLHQISSETILFALSTLLQTREGRIAVIYSSNSMLNLDLVSDHLGTEVRAVLCEDKQRFLDKKKLDLLPAIPQATDYTTYIDPALLEAEKVIFASGTAGVLIKMDQSSYHQITETCEAFNIAVPLSQIKPNCGNPELDKDNIYSAVQSYTSLSIKKRLTETLEIPSLSVTAQKIIKLSANPNASAEELVNIVELDPSLSAQVVGWAASPYFSAPGSINSIHDAIVRVLGFDLVLNLSLGIAIGKTLSIPEDCANGITPFWRQSIYCALTMEKLHRRLPPGQRGLGGFAYLTGLLNNFGFLVLGNSFPSHWSLICRQIEANGHLHPMYIEQHTLGITRDQISSQLMDAWNLPQEIVRSLRFQNDASYDGQHALYANLCYIAKRLLATKQIGDIPVQTIPVELYQRLELDPSATEEVMAEVMAASMKIEAMTAAIGD